jgi:hypothetical protein
LPPVRFRFEDDGAASPIVAGLRMGSDSFLMKFAGDCGSQTENQRHADGLSDLIASTEWFGV